MKPAQVLDLSGFSFPWASRESVDIRNEKHYNKHHKHSWRCLCCQMLRFAVRKRA
jgi:hypothetical protein